MNLKPITPPDVEALKLRAVGILNRLALEERDALSKHVASANATLTVEDFALQQGRLDTVQAVLLAIRIVQGEVTLEGHELHRAPLPPGIAPKFELEDAIKRLATEGSSDAVREDQVRVQRANQPR